MLALNMCSSFVSRGYQVILCLYVKVKRAIPRKKMYTDLYDVVYAREETTPWLRLCFLQANTKIYVMGTNLCTRI